MYWFCTRSLYIKVRQCIKLDDIRAMVLVRKVSNSLNYKIADSQEYCENGSCLKNYPVSEDVIDMVARRPEPIRIVDIDTSPMESNKNDQK